MMNDIPPRIQAQFNNYFIDWKEFQVRNRGRGTAILGNGSFGEVFEAQHQRLGQVAIKDTPEEGVEVTLHQEIDNYFTFIVPPTPLHNTRCHENVVQLLGVSEALDDFDRSRSLALIMEKADFSVRQLLNATSQNASRCVRNVQDRLESTFGINFDAPTSEIPFHHVYEWCLQLTRGVNFLHNNPNPAKRSVHHDITPSNLLIFLQGGDGGDDHSSVMTLRIGDMGALRSVGSINDERIAAVFPRTRTQNHYVPGELFGREGTRDGAAYNTASPTFDVYSIGVVMEELLASSTPALGLFNSDAQTQAKRTENIRQAIELCKAASPTTRPADAGAVYTILIGNGAQNHPPVGDMRGGGAAPDGGASAGNGGTAGANNNNNCSSNNTTTTTNNNNSTTTNNNNNNNNSCDNDNNINTDERRRVDCDSNSMLLLRRQDKKIDWEFDWMYTKKSKFIPSKCTPPEYWADRWQNHQRARHTSSKSSPSGDLLLIDSFHQLWNNNRYLGQTCEFHRLGFALQDLSWTPSAASSIWYRSEEIRDATHVLFRFVTALHSQATATTSDGTPDSVVASAWAKSQSISKTKTLAVTFLHSSFSTSSFLGLHDLYVQNPNESQTADSDVGKLVMCLRQNCSPEFNANHYLLFAWQFVATDAELERILIVGPAPTPQSRRVAHMKTSFFFGAEDAMKSQSTGSADQDDRSAVEGTLVLFAVSVSTRFMRADHASQELPESCCVIHEQRELLIANPLRALPIAFVSVGSATAASAGSSSESDSQSAKTLRANRNTSTPIGNIIASGSGITSDEKKKDSPPDPIAGAASVV